MKRLAALLALLPLPAFAHHAMGGATPSTLGQAFISGIAHPVIGLDRSPFNRAHANRSRPPFDRASSRA